MSAAWGWLTLALGITAYVVAYDLWAIRGHHYTLTRQMHDWMFSPVIGPVVFGVAAGVLTGLLLHFLMYHVHLRP